jgi:hypothetical protein
MKDEKLSGVCNIEEWLSVDADKEVQEGKIAFGIRRGKSNTA